MIRLIQVDLRRVCRDKLFLIACILATVFAVSTPLLYFVLFEVMGSSLGETEEMLASVGVFITAKSQFFTSFSLMNNFGLIFPILLAIIFSKDFGHGTVRNKIIGGHSRTAIFLSAYFTCLIVTLVVMLAQAVLTMLVALLFFPFQDTQFFITDIGYLLLSVFFECVLYAFIAALVVTVCMTVKNAGLSAVLFLAVIMITSTVTTIVQTGTMLPSSILTPTVVRILDVLRKVDVFGYSNLIGQGVTYRLIDAFCYGTVPLVAAAALLAFGIWRFRRSDLK